MGSSCWPSMATRREGRQPNACGRRPAPEWSSVWGRPPGRQRSRFARRQPLIRCGLGAPERLADDDRPVVANRDRRAFHYRSHIEGPSTTVLMLRQRRTHRPARRLRRGMATSAQPWMTSSRLAPASVLGIVLRCTRSARAIALEPRCWPIRIRRYLKSVWRCPRRRKPGLDASVRTRYLGLSSPSSLSSP